MTPKRERLQVAVHTYGLKLRLPQALQVATRPIFQRQVNLSDDHQR